MYWRLYKKEQHLSFSEVLSQTSHQHILKFWWHLNIVKELWPYLFLKVYWWLLCLLPIFQLFFFSERKEMTRLKEGFWDFIWETGTEYWQSLLTCFREIYLFSFNIFTGRGRHTFLNLGWTEILIAVTLLLAEHEFDSFGCIFIL